MNSLTAVLVQQYVSRTFCQPGQEVNPLLRVGPQKKKICSYGANPMLEPLC